MSITEQSESKPTVVLVHGAFAESSSWSGVITRLLDDGFPAIAVANPLRGVSFDSDYLRATLADISGDIVLVGHSYGGTVISGGGTGNQQVKALVYIGAFAPDAGETPGDLAGKLPGSTLAETLTQVPLADGGVDLYIKQDDYRAQFAADSSAEVASVMAVTQRPILESAFGEASGEPAWKSIPSWFLFGELDKNIPAAVHHFMAERAGARKTIELAGGSHTVGIPEAAQVFDLIREAAEATARD
ncbi:MULTISPECIES: alpha/beta fold hydrolase [unclassified Leifsonia]|uniref:alpha/beta fold hydrolase n=1 Tax=unclassified Leifsonia TaxID=2663824 RepID=UPI0007005476|nr:MULTISPECIES: alpha/beta hydrolase [unclassified Leifsonia]KQX06892.1 alpha/beta hydrolase [Leifsonia sp. Root1293]KRA11177.1 alpha/beta hydrolase [Leifsonia sp. Root60]